MFTLHYHFHSKIRRASLYRLRNEETPPPFWLLSLLGD
jgi:hypothetical protein